MKVSQLRMILETLPPDSEVLLELSDMNWSKSFALHQGTYSPKTGCVDRTAAWQMKKNDALPCVVIKPYITK